MRGEYEREGVKIVRNVIEAGEHVHSSLYALKCCRTHNGQRCCGNPAIRAAGLRAARPQ